MADGVGVRAGVCGVRGVGTGSEPLPGSKFGSTATRLGRDVSPCKYSRSLKLVSGTAAPLTELEVVQA